MPAETGTQPDYLPNLTGRLLLCFLPLDGLKLSLILVCSLPAFFWCRTIVTVSRPDGDLLPVLNPLPVAVSFPPAGTATFNVIVRPFTFFDTTLSVLEQPSTSMWVLWSSVAPFWATNCVGITSFD